MPERPGYITDLVRQHKRVTAANQRPHEGFLEKPQRLRARNSVCKEVADHCPDLLRQQHAAFEWVIYDDCQAFW
jgi:hypothetical protein